MDAKHLAQAKMIGYDKTEFSEDTEGVSDQIPISTVLEMILFYHALVSRRF